MFLKYIDFIFAPFRAINNKIVNAKNIKGSFQVDVNQSKAMMRRGKQFAGEANAQVQKYGGQPQAAGGQPQAGAQQPAQQPGYPPQAQPGYPPQAQGYQQQGGQYMQQGMPQGAPQMPGAPPMPGPPGAPNPNPPIRTQGFWIFKKKFCTQCEQQLDRSWDACPFCAQIAAQAAVAPQKLQVLKTQAFVLDSAGGPGSTQLLGWLVPLQGPNKGELFTLAPVTVIGTEPTCNICLNDKFMSQKHAEIKAENGMWVLRDAGSTNGTYVNNRRVDRHELVDNDFIKFGAAMCKFKSL